MIFLVKLHFYLYFLNLISMPKTTNKNSWIQRLGRHKMKDPKECIHKLREMIRNAPVSHRLGKGIKENRWLRGKRKESVLKKAIERNSQTIWRYPRKWGGARTYSQLLRMKHLLGMHLLYIDSQISERSVGKKPKSIKKWNTKSQENCEPLKRVSTNAVRKYTGWRKEVLIHQIFVSKMFQGHQVTPEVKKDNLHEQVHKKIIFVNCISGRIVQKCTMKKCFQQHSF